MAKHRAQSVVDWQPLKLVLAILVGLAIVIAILAAYKSVLDITTSRAVGSVSVSSSSSDQTPQMTTIEGVTFGNCTLPGYKPGDAALPKTMLCHELDGVKEPVPDAVSQITLYGVLYGCQSHLSQLDPHISRCSRTQLV